MSDYKVAIIGCGNVGKNAINAVLAAPDMQLTGIVERPEMFAELKKKFDCPIVDSVSKLTAPDGVLLCLPSSMVPKTVPELLRQGIATADCFDVHGQPLLDMLESFQEAAVTGGAASVSAAGWDPGADSIVRVLFQVMAPQGITQTNFGPGMSMGHTVAVKAIDGVRDAISMTIPKGLGIHHRQVYVELEHGTNFQTVEEKINANRYFRNNETTVTQVDNISALMDMGHGVHIQRYGVSSGVHNQRMNYSIRVTNPAVTAQVMVCGLRGALRQTPGAYVLLQVPILDLLPGDRDKIIRELC